MDGLGLRPSRRRGRPGRVALSGGIGSGKSTVAALLAGFGAAVVDTDAISRALTARGGAALPAIVAAFGAQAITADGAMDRARMRALVFDDPAARARLEALLHPLIGEHALREADAAQAAGRRPIVFDIPLLGPGSPWLERVDRVVVVDCEPATQVARVAARSGWSEDEVRRVIAQQTPRQARLALADDVIDNGAATSLQALRRQVGALWALWNNGSP